MRTETIAWAGVPFLPLFHRDGRFFRCPGLFAFVRRDGEERTLLYVDQAESIAAATGVHKLWGELIQLGCNELHVNLKAVARIDRLILRAHIVKRCEPLLNLLEEGAAPPPEIAPVSDRRRA
jgi:hypothetical protein